jgi:hypothetical protein
VTVCTGSCGSTVFVVFWTGLLFYSESTCELTLSSVMCSLLLWWLGKHQTWLRLYWQTVRGDVSSVINFFWVSAYDFLAKYCQQTTVLLAKCWQHKNKSKKFATRAATTQALTLLVFCLLFEVYHQVCTCPVLHNASHALLDPLLCCF